MTRPTSPHPKNWVLQAYETGSLGVSAMESVREHLVHCDECRSRLTPLADTRTMDAPPRPRPVDHDEFPADLLGLKQYELRGRIGGGGMGVVYLAYHKYTNRLEALKVINKDLLERRGVLDRFLREIAAACKLNHPNVATAYTALPAGNSLVFAMEHIDGRDLGQVVKQRGPLPVAVAADFIRQAALGLQHAHEKGLVHRDVKPQNMMVSNERGEGGMGPVVKLLDFGLAKAVSEDAHAADLTSAEVVLGSPHYMAPEQAEDARKADVRADIYGLGCTLYFLLTGRPPFQAASLTGLLLAHQRDDPVPVRELRPDVPRELADVLARMMAKRPEARYQEPSEVARALSPFIKHAEPALAPALRPPPRDDLDTTRKRPTDPATVAEGPIPSPQTARGAFRLPIKWQVGCPVVAGVVLLAFLLLVTLLAYLLGPTPKGQDGDEGSFAHEPWVGSQAGDLQVVQTGRQEIRLRWCPPGTFRMGHGFVTTTLSQGFWIMETEVWQKLWEETGEELDWSRFGGSPDLPAYNVSHVDAEEFASLLTTHLHLKGTLPKDLAMTLPTEAQWEYAARAGSDARFAFGDDESQLPNHAWYDRNAGGKVHPVGTRKGNRWGLKDMAGNVAEWCADSLEVMNDGAVDPIGLMGTADRCLRGGSYLSGAEVCEAASRVKLGPRVRFRNQGLRLVVCPKSPG